MWGDHRANPLKILPAGQMMGAAAAYDLIAWSRKRFFRTRGSGFAVQQKQKETNCIKWKMRGYVCPMNLMPMMISASSRF